MLVYVFPLHDLLISAKHGEHKTQNRLVTMTKTLTRIPLSSTSKDHKVPHDLLVTTKDEECYDDDFDSDSSDSGHISDSIETDNSLLSNYVKCGRGSILSNYSITDESKTVCHRGLYSSDFISFTFMFLYTLGGNHIPEIGGYEITKNK